MGAQHTPVALYIGQRVRHRDYKGQRVTGVVRGLALDSDGRLDADIVLDAPIVIPGGDGWHAIDIHRQHVPAHELTPFDDRDEIVDALLQALQPFVEFNSSEETITITLRTADITRARAAIARAEGRS